MLVNVGFSYCIRDNQQKTFVMLSRLFLLSKNLESSLLLKDNNKLDETPTKNACPFYIAFQVLKLLLIKICKIQPAIFYFLFLLAFICCYYLLVFISFYMR